MTKQQSAPATSGASVLATVQQWFTEQVPTAWVEAAPEVLLDDDEVLVILPLAVEAGADALRRIAEVRAQTKQDRMAIAEEGQRLFRRSVSWGARAGEVRQLFTGLSVPVMTRLRLPDRALLDTLVESGVARSRSDAVGWCVRLVGQHESDWLEELRQALVEVRRVRREGPQVA